MHASPSSKLTFGSQLPMLAKYNDGDLCSAAL